MENKEIMDRLLQEDKPTSDIKEDVYLAKHSGEPSISKIRRVTAKYKLYIIILVIIIFCFLFFWIPNITDKLEASRTTYNNDTARLNALLNDIRNAEDDMKYLCDDTNGVVKNEEALRTCLNKKDGCTNLPEQWKTGSGNSLEDYNTKVPLSYLQLQSLYNKKMPVDEKRVLKNLNEYLIKQNISGGGKEEVGEILTINIGDPEVIGYGVKETPTGDPKNPIKKENIPNFFQVTVDVEIEFETVKDLVEFLYNVEKKMVNNTEDRILYKIQSVSYDVVSNNEPQITDISMIAYYYDDEKFNNMVECTELENQEVKEEQTDTNDEESDSIFDKIFSDF